MTSLIATLSFAPALLAAPNAPQVAPQPPRTHSVAMRDSERDIMKIIDRNEAYANPEAALMKLMRGNRRFQAGRSLHPRQNQDALKSSKEGQKPFAIIMGCSDSRVPAELIFDQGLGDLFIIRTAGQVATSASYGTIEYGTAVLGSNLIVVLGHESCGAVDAAMKRPEVPGHIVTLINSIKSSAAKVKEMPGNGLNNAIRQNVIDQVNELRDLDPVLRRQYENGEVLIVGAVYNFGKGEVEFLPETLVNLPVPAKKR